MYQKWATGCLTKSLLQGGQLWVRLAALVSKEQIRGGLDSVYKSPSSLVPQFFPWGRKKKIKVNNMVPKPQARAELETETMIIKFCLMPRWKVIYKKKKKRTSTIRVEVGQLLALARGWRKPEDSSTWKCCRKDKLWLISTVISPSITGWLGLHREDGS